MHPAFSVIFFTTFSGAGYGLWIWLGLLAAGDALPGRTPSLIALMLGFVCVTAGLLSSTLHLGQPQRAWRAFSQWRSSWLSREGVASLSCFVPMLWLGASIWFDYDGRVAGLLLAVLSLVTVVCTAMIYASLKPIPAWRHPLVVPVYLLFAAFTGGLLLATILSLSGASAGNMAGFGALLGAVALWRLKRHAWRAIDRGDLPVSRASALGLPEDRTATVFERPHTEANYLNREMGFVVARKHSRKLRSIALILFALIPAMCALPVWFIVHLDATPWLLVASLSALAGTLVERWLFFAEAKHLVTLYY
ncbi:MAG: dimethyl sulfoxide reductase anchor subunit [Arenimonas sp.]|nr:dimethyl sulfoxide reductase anchor subunit [Arenimonas sp.]